MVAAVKDLPQEILDEIEYRQWSLRTLEGVRRFQELGAKNLPSIAIEGALVFEAQIPPAEDLIAAIAAGSPVRRDT
jgi:hypothetical protein